MVRVPIETCSLAVFLDAFAGPVPECFVFLDVFLSFVEGLFLVDGLLCSGVVGAKGMPGCFSLECSDFELSLGMASSVSILRAGGASIVALRAIAMRAMAYTMSFSFPVTVLARQKAAAFTLLVKLGHAR